MEPWDLYSREPAVSTQAPLYGSFGGEIAFVSNRDGNPGIYTVNDDGSGLLRLTRSPGSALSGRLMAAALASWRDAEGSARL